MIATIVPDMRNHYPVLLSELISIITPQYGGIFIDCTFGQGGYTNKILSFPETKVIALDRDLESLKKAEIFQNKFADRFLFKTINFFVFLKMQEFLDHHHHNYSLYFLKTANPHFLWPHYLN